jgi:hypothetical protein
MPPSKLTSKPSSVAGLERIRVNALKCVLVDLNQHTTLTAIGTDGINDQAINLTFENSLGSMLRAILNKRVEEDAVSFRCYDSSSAPTLLNRDCSGHGKAGKANSGDKTAEHIY